MVQKGGCIPGGAGRGWEHLLEVVGKAEFSLGQADPERFLPAPNALLLHSPRTLENTSLQLQSAHLRGDLGHKDCVLVLSGLTSLTRNYQLVIIQILRML